MSLTIEKFIQLVRQRPLLYDVFNDDYKNREKRSEAWDEIALEMGIQEGIYWSCRWKSLKDNYNKFKKSSQKGYSKYKNWPWAKYMTFCDYNTNVPDNTENSVNPENRNDMQDQTPETSIKEEPTTSIDDAHDVSPNDLFVEFKGFRKRTLNNAEVVNKKMRLDSKKKLDEIDCFFHSYAQACKRLPGGMQSMLKLEIATLFSWYELQVQKDDNSRMTQPTLRPKGDVLSTSKGSWITYSPLFISSSELGRPNTVCPSGSAVPRQIPVNITGEKEDEDDDDDDDPLITLKSEQTEADGSSKLMTGDTKTTLTVKIEHDCDDVTFTNNTVTGDDVVNSAEE